MLDVGCGHKFTAAIVNHGLPIGRYVGIDIDRELVEFLQREVDDPRLEYHLMDTHNEMYNPSGRPLSLETPLPVGDARFDVITGYSLFTHLGPDDFRTMLALMRRHVAPEGRLLFTVFIDEVTEGGHGLIDKAAKKLGIEQGYTPQVDYLDARPDKPLSWALYSRERVVQAIEASGWRLDSIGDPDLHIQHFCVCSPAD